MSRKLPLHKLFLVLFLLPTVAMVQWFQIDNTINGASDEKLNSYRRTNINSVSKNKGQIDLSAYPTGQYILITKR